MADPVEHKAPPAGEEVHLPGNTALPLFTAIGITLTVIGTTIGLIPLIVGVLLSLYCIVRWIRETRHSISELPPEL